MIHIERSHDPYIDSIMYLGYLQIQTYIHTCGIINCDINVLD